MASAAQDLIILISFFQTFRLVAEVTAGNAGGRPAQGPARAAARRSPAPGEKADAAFSLVEKQV